MKEKDSASQTTTKTSNISYREAIAYDENGEIIFDALYRPKSQNGSGFMLCYMSMIGDLVTNVKQASILRVFLYISSHQNYGNDGVFGYRCSKKHLQDVLGIQKPTLWSAINWLKDNFLINETKIAGVFEYMVNPDFVTIGKDKKMRVAEWNRRCEAYLKKLESKSTKLLRLELVPDAPDRD